MGARVPACSAASVRRLGHFSEDMAPTDKIWLRKPNILEGVLEFSLFIRTHAHYFGHGVRVA
jgi:hypothetical protein